MAVFKLYSWNIISEFFNIFIELSCWPHFHNMFNNNYLIFQQCRAKEKCIFLQEIETLSQILQYCYILWSYRLSIVYGIKSLWSWRIKLNSIAGQRAGAGQLFWWGHTMSGFGNQPVYCVHSSAGLNYSKPNQPAVKFCIFWLTSLPNMFNDNRLLTSELHFGSEMHFTISDL